MVSGLFLASYSSIGSVLSTWEQMGFFDYLLPFLLIFAMVFGILTRINVFKDNKAVNGIIALAVGLMALQFNFVSVFFAEIFPRLGIALSVILAVIILLGLFIDQETNWMMYFLFGVGLIAVISVLINTGSAVGWSSASWWTENWQMIIGMIVFVLLVVLIITGVPSSSAHSKSPYARSSRGKED